MDFEHGRREIRFSEEQDQPASSTTPPLVIEKEHMFDKVVTPSDVGKLNRLVIPKQHAEKYFPLDAAANDTKGLLLNFEDRNGKPWRFRYSYWNSSQSYVMTKGWSRFVKEKRLDAGDTVSFGRGVGEAARERLFIDWKRRPDQVLIEPPRYPQQYPFSFNRFVPTSLYEHHRRSYDGNFSSTSSGIGGQYYYFSPTVAAAAPPVHSLPVVLESVPVIHTHNQVVAKRVRLFGVNLDCPESDADDGKQSSLPRHLQLRLGGDD